MRLYPTHYTTNFSHSISISPKLLNLYFYVNLLLLFPYFGPLPPQLFLVVLLEFPQSFWKSPFEIIVTSLRYSVIVIKTSCHGCNLYFLFNVQVAVELLKILLHLEDEFNITGFYDMRKESICLIVCKCPHQVCLNF